MIAARRLLCRAAVVAGGALLASGAVVAREGAPYAAAGERLLLAHAGHKAAAAPEAAGGEYKRSVRDYSVPDVTLVDRDARPVRLREMLAADEPVMVNFIFTTCGAICPVMSKIFADVPKRLGTGAGALRMISISIDPENDTPQALKAYAGKFDAGPQWQFLTGSVKDIAAVQRAFDSYNDDKMSHEPLTLLRAAPGGPWVRIDGFASPGELVREYRKVVKR